MCRPRFSGRWTWAVLVLAIQAGAGSGAEVSTVASTNAVVGTNAASTNAAAGDVATNLPPKFKLASARSTGAFGVTVTHGYITAETNKFSFLFPKDFFQTAGGSSDKRVSLNSRDAQCAMSVAVTEVITNKAVPELKHEMFRESVLQRFPSAKIMEEASCNALGATGPSFELRWRGGTGAAMESRVMYVPFPGGYLEFVFTVPVARIDHYASIMNHWMLSFRSSPIDGKLDVQQFKVAE